MTSFNSTATLAATLAAMKQAHVQAGPASPQLRRDRLTRGGIEEPLIDTLG